MKAAFYVIEEIERKRGRSLIWLLVHGDGQNMVGEISENMFVIQIKGSIICLFNVRSSVLTESINSFPERVTVIACTCFSAVRSASMIY